MGLLNPLQFLRMPQTPNPRDLLPPPAVVRKLLDVFFQNVHPFLPIIHRDSFLATLDSQSPLLVLSLCGSTTARGVSGLDAELSAHAERCLETCSALLIPAMVSPDPVPIDFVLAALHFDHAAGNRTLPQITERWLGFSIAALMQRHLNVENSSPGANWIVQEQLRRSWWKIFSYDRAASMHGLRSCMLSTDSNLVRLPLPDEIWAMPESEGAIAQATVPAVYLPSGLDGIKNMIRTEGLSSWTPTALALLLLSIYGHVTRVMLGLRSLESDPNRPTNGLNRMLMAERQSISETLDLFWEALDPKMKLMDDEPLKYSKAAQFVDGRWMWEGIEGHPVTLSTLILYHAMRIHLVSPGDVSRMIKSPNWILSPDFATAVQHAGTISRLLEAILVTNPDLHFMHAGLGYCVITAASVHVFLVRSIARAHNSNRPAALTAGVNQQDVVALQQLEQLYAQTSRDVDISIRAMEGLGKRWKLLMKTGRALRQALEVMDWEGLEAGLAGFSSRPLQPGPSVSQVASSRALDAKSRGNDAENDPDDVDVENTSSGFALKVLADMAEAEVRNRMIEAAEEELERIKSASPATNLGLGLRGAGSMGSVTGGETPFVVAHRSLAVERAIMDTGNYTPSLPGSPRFLDNSNGGATPTLFPSVEGLPAYGWNQGGGIPTGVGSQEELAMLLSGDAQHNFDFTFF